MTDERDIAAWGDWLRGEPEPDVDCCPVCLASDGDHRIGCPNADGETPERRAKREQYEEGERVEATLAWRELDRG